MMNARRGKRRNLSRIEKKLDGPTQIATIDCEPGDRWIFTHLVLPEAISKEIFSWVGSCKFRPSDLIRSDGDVSCRLESIRLTIRHFALIN